MSDALLLLFGRFPQAMLIDSHCHLDYLARDGALEPVVERARAQGVSPLITICTKLSEADRILAITESFEDVYCSLGVHPHEAGREELLEPQALAALARANPKVVGIGETGLDYYYDNAPREAQQRSFRAHMTVARETGMPLIVHTRDADDDTVAMLREEQSNGSFPGIIHCFTAGAGLAEAALDMGFYISFSGIVTFNKAEDLRRIAKMIPLDRILVETDAPFLAPVPKRGKTNEPAFVCHTANFLAQLLEIEPEEFAAMTVANTYRAFEHLPRPEGSPGALSAADGAGA
jgi:TatD DNase family protein